LIPNFPSDYSTSPIFGAYYCGIKNEKRFPIKVSVENINPGDKFSFLDKLYQIPPNSTLITIESMPSISGMISTTLDSEILSVNDSFARFLFGYSETEIVGRNLSNFIPELLDCLSGMKWMFAESRHRAFDKPNLSCLTNLSELSRRRSYHEQFSEKIQCFCTSNYTHLCAIHRDGSKIPIAIQCCKWNSGKNSDSLHAVWIVFQRDTIGTGLRGKSCLSPVLRPLEFKLDAPPMESSKSPIEILAPHQSHKHSPPRRFVFPENVKYDIEDFNVIESIGEGTYSFVKLCKFSKDPGGVINI
jgi:hypothetical protein